MIDQHKESPQFINTPQGQTSVLDLAGKTGRRMRAAVQSRGTEKDLTVWADIFLDRYGKIIDKAPSEYERKKISQFLQALQSGLSWREAATIAEFRSEKPDICPPASKARIVMTSFLERQPDGKELLNSLQTLHPEYETAPIIIEPSWVAECERKGDFGGRVRSITTEKPGLIRPVFDNDRGILFCRVEGGTSNEELHQQSIDKVVGKLLEGKLNVLQFTEAQHAGLKVEPACANGKYLVCLHSHAETRIYGVYDKNTGTITWRGIIDHRKWSPFVKQFKG